MEIQVTEEGWVIKVFTKKLIKYLFIVFYIKTIQ